MSNVVQEIRRCKARKGISVKDDVILGYRS